MSPPLNPWQEYADLVAQAEKVFRRVSREYPAEVRCRLGCDDCCQAPFRLSLIEAAALKAALLSLDRNIRRQILRRAEKGLPAARALFAGLPDDPQAAALALARARLKCPLLTGAGCAVYPARPITCRLYGLPTQSAGQSHTCPRSGFEPGREYPTVNLDLIARRLAEISGRLAALAGLDLRGEAGQSVAEALLKDYPAGLLPGT